MTDSSPTLQWNPPLDSATLALIDSAVADSGTLGHAEPMSPQTASTGTSWFSLSPTCVGGSVMLAPWNRR